MGVLAACGGRSLYNPTSCGDGLLDNSEECDDGNTDDGDGCDALCAREGDAACGNGILETGEDCDGTAMNGADCESLGWDSGTLACAADCTYDAAGCQGSAGECGDGILDAGEACDGTNLGSATCQSLGHTGGALSCSASCGLDESQCTDAQPVCGDGVAEATEACDGGDLRGASCGDLGWDDGTLACDPDCVVDESQCFNHGPGCGNGVVDGMMEECDGNDLDGESCQSLGFPPQPGSSLACAASCNFDTSGCMGGQPSTCTAAGGSVSCGTTLTGDNASGTADVMFWSGQGCGQFPLDGPELIYTFTASSQSEWLSVDLTGLSADVDLLVLEDSGSGCETDLECVEVSTSPNNQSEQVEFQTSPGATYYVVVDGWQGASTSYSLQISCY